MAFAQALAREFDAVGVVNVGVGREIRRRRYLAALSGRQNVSALARRRFQGGGDFSALVARGALAALPEALAGFPGVGFLTASIGPQYHSPPAVFLTSKSVPTTASEP